MELRRRFKVPDVTGRLLLFYATAPTCAVIGSARVANVTGLPVEQLWRSFWGAAAVTREHFDVYFAGALVGYALELQSVVTFADIDAPCGDVRQMPLCKC